MKFQIEQSLLLNEVQRMIGVIPSKTPISILETFLFRLEGNQMQISATDLDVSLTSTIDVTGIQDGEISLPAKKLMELVRELPSEQLTIDSHGENNVQISTALGQFNIPGKEPDNFPVLPEIEKIADIKIDPERFLHFINHAGFSVSHDPLRPALTGVLFQFAADKLTVVSTDGHRLSKIVDNDFASGIENTQLIIPSPALNQLGKLLADSSESLRMGIARNHVVFEFQHTTMYCRLIDGKYPPFDSVIPNENSRDMIAELKLVTQSLRRVSTLSNMNTRQVIFSLSANELTLHAEDSEFGSRAEEKITVNHTGDDFQVAFDYIYLQEIFKHVGSDDVLFKFGDFTKPVLIFPQGDQKGLDVLFLLMPIRMS